jgi:hypothetical protein
VALLVLANPAEAVLTFPQGASARAGSTNDAIAFRVPVSGLEGAYLVVRRHLKFSPAFKTFVAPMECRKKGFVRETELLHPLTKAMKMHQPYSGWSDWVAEHSPVARAESGRIDAASACRESGAAGREGRKRLD